MAFYVGSNLIKNVNVAIDDITRISLQEKTISPTNTQQSITADDNYDGLSKVTVNAVSLQSKSISPTKAQQIVTMDNDYNGLSQVTVNAIPDEYIITTNANASANDIIENKTAYVNGSKITGTLVIQKYYTGSTTPSQSLGKNGDIYLQK